MHTETTTTAKKELGGIGLNVTLDQTKISHTVIESSETSSATSQETIQEEIIQVATLEITEAEQKILSSGAACNINDPTCEECQA